MSRQGMTQYLLGHEIDFLFCVPRLKLKCDMHFFLKVNLKCGSVFNHQKSQMRYIFFHFTEKRVLKIVLVCVSCAPPTIRDPIATSLVIKKMSSIAIIITDNQDLSWL